MEVRRSAMGGGENGGETEGVIRRVIGGL